MNDFDWAYTDIVKEHFMNPKNILEDEKAFNECGRGMVGDVKCGDQMLLVIDIDKDEGIIRDCKWKTYGCASAIASTSVLSEMVKGMKLEKAFALTPKEIMKKLGGLPDHKVHCSVLGDKALRAAINDYYKRNNLQHQVREEKETIICQCMSVSDLEIEHAVLEGARDYLRLQEMTKVGTVCGQCKDEVVKVMDTAIKLHFS